MISEIDLLREEIPRLEQKFGAKNLFVEVLKSRLADLHNQSKPQPDRQNKPQSIGGEKDLHSRSRMRL